MKLTKGMLVVGVMLSFAAEGAKTVGINAPGASSQKRLVTTYAVIPKLCQVFLDTYSSFNACPLTDENCFVTKWDKENNSEITKIPPTELAVNEYGYTAISVAHTSDKPYTVIYLNGFQGDRHPRLLETWKVKTEQLKALTERQPLPLQYNEWVKGAHQIKKETLGPEFAQVLSEGEKLSDDRSPVWMPIFRVRGTDYAVSRECVGAWVYGGYYACNAIIKVIVKRINTDKAATPICEFARTKTR